MLNIATIVSANYLAYAVTLGKSLQREHPEAKFSVLIVDRPTEAIKEAAAASKLDITYGAELGLPDFEHIAFKYDIVEFNTALKPTFLKRLFALGADQVIYLDPDIEVFEKLDPVLEELSTHDIVFTPHATKPVMDGARPSDIDFMRNGVFNLGFVALRKTDNALAMLDWWESRCLAYGFNDVGSGIFVDQKWMNLVPCYFERVGVLKHPGCNVAYWNLHERQLTFSGERKILVNGVPLIFFHFSGVKASAPEQLSRHQTRHKLTNGSVLQKLVSNYCESLNSNGHAQFSVINYSYGAFDNNVEITAFARRAATFENISNPFDAKQHFYKKMMSLGALDKVHGLPSSNTLLFNQESKQVRLVNTSISIASRFLGINRMQALIKYFAYLSKEANFSRVILKNKFDFSHRENSSRPSIE
jgi:hypothetical protein